MPSSAQTVGSSPFAEPWPEGVIARYLTVGGATVDLTDDGRPHWRCTACPGTSRGAYTGPFGDPFTSAEIHKQAQEHAEKCRAMPRPVAHAGRRSEPAPLPPAPGMPNWVRPDGWDARRTIA